MAKAGTNMRKRVECEKSTSCVLLRFPYLIAGNRQVQGSLQRRVLVRRFSQICADCQTRKWRRLAFPESALICGQKRIESASEADPSSQALSTMRSYSKLSAPKLISKATFMPVALR